MLQENLARFGEVPFGRLVDQFFAGITETDLNGGITVDVRSLELGDAAGPRLDQGDRDGSALIVEELRHAQFLPKDAD